MMNDLIGVPFIDGGRDKAVGLDCWGLATEVFRRYGMELPDYKVCCEDMAMINATIDTQRARWHRVEPPNLPVPCLVVIKFNTPIFCNHTGVYIGNDKFIHTRQKIGVNIDSVDSIVWRKKIEGYYVPSKEVTCCNKQSP